MRLVVNHAAQIQGPWVRQSIIVVRKNSSKGFNSIVNDLRRVEKGEDKAEPPIKESLQVYRQIIRLDANH